MTHSLTPVEIYKLRQLKAAADYRFQTHPSVAQRLKTYEADMEALQEQDRKTRGAIGDLIAAGRIPECRVFPGWRIVKGASLPGRRVA